MRELAVRHHPVRQSGLAAARGEPRRDGVQCVDIDRHHDVPRSSLGCRARPAATPRRPLPSGRSSSLQPTRISNLAWAGEETPASQRRVAAPKMACTHRQQLPLLGADRRAAARHVLEHLQVQVLDLLDDLAVAAPGLADDPAQRGGQPRLALLGAELAQQVAGDPVARASRQAGPRRSPGPAPRSTGSAGCQAARDPWPGSTGTASPPRRPARCDRSFICSASSPPAASMAVAAARIRSCRPCCAAVDGMAGPACGTPADPLSGIRSAFGRGQAALAIAMCAWPPARSRASPRAGRAGRRARPAAPCWTGRSCSTGARRAPR